VTGALVVFCVTYLLIASRELHFLKLDRPAAATVGAVAMVVVGGLPMDAALHAIDLHVLVLLFGVLMIAAYLQEAGFFRLAAYVVLTRAGSARTLMFGLVFVAGGLSAFLVNDTVCIVLTPLVVAVAVEARLPALPYLIGLASAANVGGVVSLAGNPQNMIVGAAAEGRLGFGSYMLHTLPIGVVCLAANALILVWLFRFDLPDGALVERSPPRPAVDKLLTIKGLAALVLFAILAFAGVSLAGAAVTAAAALLLSARSRVPRDAFRHIDWPLLVFFAGLFVVVAGIAHAGVIAKLFGHVGPVIDRGDLTGDLAFIAIVVIASNIVSNVPFVLVAVAWVPHMHDPTWGFMMLAVASTLAGNLTLFGSVAYIIVLESAGPRGEIGFWRFLRYGALITVVDLVLAFGILYGERALGVQL
jgi:Na+/H+ antiporter NhaD/arsenite permease-like protein